MKWTLAILPDFHGTIIERNRKGRILSRRDAILFFLLRLFAVFFSYLIGSLHHLGYIYIRWCLCMHLEMEI